MSAETFALRFRRGQAPARNLETEARSVLQELADLESEASKNARESGIEAVAPEKITVSIAEEQQGLDAATTTVLVTIATELGIHVAKRVWDHVIWPRLERKFGIKALGEPAD